MCSKFIGVLLTAMLLGGCGAEQLLPAAALPAYNRLTEPTLLLFTTVWLGTMWLLFYYLRRWVRKQGEWIASQIDPFDYVILEAHPDQLPELQREFQQGGWRLDKANSSNGEGYLYMFVKLTPGSVPLSRLLGVGPEPRTVPQKKSAVNFQMKIKAHGLLKDLIA